MKNSQYIKMLAMEVICKLEMMEELCLTTNDNCSSLKFEIDHATISMVNIRQMIEEFS